MNLVKTVVALLATAILCGCAGFAKEGDGKDWIGFMGVRSYDRHMENMVDLKHKDKMNDQLLMEREMASNIMLARMSGGDKAYAKDVATPAGLASGMVFNNSEEDVLFHCKGPREKSWAVQKKSSLRTELPPGEYACSVKFIGSKEESKKKILVDFQEDELQINNEKIRVGWFIVAGPPSKRR